MAFPTAPHNKLLSLLSLHIRESLLIKYSSWISPLFFHITKIPVVKKRIVFLINLAFYFRLVKPS